MKTNFDENDDFTLFTDAELRLAERHYLPYTVVYQKAVEEIYKRKSVINTKKDKTEIENKKTQTEIKVMTLVILILTTAMLAISVYQLSIPYFNDKTNTEINPKHNTETKN